MAISTAFLELVALGPRLTELAMSYCGHLPASPLQPPSAQNDIYNTIAIGDEPKELPAPN